MKRPVFLISSERSGSNLIRVMLGNHSSFVAPAPPHLLKNFLPLLPFYGDLREVESLRLLARDMTAVMNDQVGSWRTRLSGDELAAVVSEPSYAGLFDAVYRKEAEAHGKTRSFVKDNGVAEFAFEILALFPDARFVALVRDPRDVAASWLRSVSHAGGVLQAARAWVRDQRALLRILAVLHDKQRVHLVHYEGLIESPEEELRTLCKFLSEPFEPAMLEFHKSEEAATGAHRVADWANLARPVMSGNTGNWRTQLSPRQVHLVEKSAGVEMRMLGYEPEFSRGAGGNALEDLGKFGRAMRSLMKLVVAGRRGRREIRVRVNRLRGLREIQARVRRNPPQWSNPRPGGATAGSETG